MDCAKNYFLWLVDKEIKVNRYMKRNIIVLDNLMILYFKSVYHWSVAWRKGHTKHNILAVRKPFFTKVLECKKIDTTKLNDA